MATKGLNKTILFYLVVLSFLQLSLDYVEADNDKSLTLNRISSPTVGAGFSADKERIVEHVVLLKLKPDLSPSQLATVYRLISALRTIPGIVHFSFGPIRRVISPTLSFSHVLHIRFRSKAAAVAYNLNPTHLTVLAAGTPFLDDFLQVFWVAQPSQPQPVSPPVGSAVKVQLLKLKGKNDNCSSIDKEMLKVDVELKGRLLGLQQLTFGDNYSPVTGKGFSFGILGVFSGSDQLDRVEGFVDVKRCIGESLVVEFVSMSLDDHQSAAPATAPAPIGL